MKIFQRLQGRLVSLIFASKARLFSIKDRVANEVPYFCQFGANKSSDLILTKQLELLDDPNWRGSGANNQEAYQKWTLNICGMACTSMILKYFFNQTSLPVPLAEEAVIEGVYEEDENGHMSDMKYIQYVKWISRFGLKGTVLSRLSVQGVLLALSNDSLVMVSVNPNIRGYQTAPASQKGGHLVLVTGYDKTKQTFTINNPSGFVSLGTQAGHVLSFVDFSKYFAGRGIVVGV